MHINNLSASLTFIIVTVTVALAVRAQTPPHTPKEVVQRFVDLDTRGMRLTSEGWQEADALFTEPSRRPPRKSLIIIAEHFAVSSGTTNENNAHFYFGYEELGRVGPELRFTPAMAKTETRSMDEYELTSFDTRRTNDDASWKPAKGLDWKIKGPQPSVSHLTVDAAIRYIIRERSQATDPAVEKNADATLAALKRFR